MFVPFAVKAAALPLALLLGLPGLHGPQAQHGQAGDQGRHGPHDGGRTPLGVDTTAPVITREDIVVQAPLERIWKIQTDVENWPEWQPDVSEATKVTPGPLRPGSVFQWSVEGLSDIASTVQQVEPGRRIVWGGPAQGITAVHVWTFTPREDGVHVHTEESWAGDPVDAATPALQAALDASLDHWVHNLKARAER